MDSAIRTGNAKSPAYYIWISSLIALMVLGGYAQIMSLLTSLEIMEFSLRIPWTMMVSNYVFLVVSSTGLCIVSSLGHVFGMKRYELLSKRCVFLALVTIIFGMSSIALHLGHPERALIYNIITPNLRSPIWWMGTLYSFYILFIAVEFWFLVRMGMAKKANSSTDLKQKIYSLMVARKTDETPESLKNDHKWARIAGVLALIFGLSAHNTLGAVFGHTEARVFWYGPYYPVYFLFSAAFCGYAWLISATIITYKVKGKEIAGKLKKLLFEMSKIFALLLCIGLLFTSYKLGFGLLNPAKAKSIMLLLNGPFSLPFWLFEIAIGSLLPIIILLYAAYKKKIGGLLTASIMVLIGVFVMRFDFLVVGEVYPMFSPMGKDALVLVPSFFPVLMEIFVIAGIFGALFLSYTLGVKFLPLEEELQ
ncbi:MAG: polysulfide reductase NrfD [SAR324 cluster bacterium]|nr:polysulfide reductase NrfD [SAR324 cluster bacterium]